MSLAPNLSDNKKGTDLLLKGKDLASTVAYSCARVFESLLRHLGHRLLLELTDRLGGRLLPTRDCKKKKSLTALLQL